MSLNVFFLVRRVSPGFTVEFELNPSVLVILTFDLNSVTPRSWVGLFALVLCLGCHKDDFQLNRRIFVDFDL